MQTMRRGQRQCVVPCNIVWMFTIKIHIKKTSIYIYIYMLVMCLFGLFGLFVWQYMFFFVKHIQTHCLLTSKYSPSHRPEVGWFSFETNVCFFRSNCVPKKSWWFPIPSQTDMVSQGCRSLPRIPTLVVSRCRVTEPLFFFWQMSCG